MNLIDLHTSTKSLNIMKIKKRNPVARDLLTDKYHMRVVAPKKIYNRAKEQSKMKKEIYGY